MVLRAYIHFTHIWVVIIFLKWKIINVGNSVEKLKPLCIAGGSVYGAATMQNGMVIPQKK